MIIDIKKIILHFVLSGIDTSGSPAKICHTFLKTFFGDALIYQEIIFNLLDNEMLENHIAMMEELVHRLLRCVLD